MKIGNLVVLLSLAANIGLAVGIARLEKISTAERTDSVSASPTAKSAPEDSTSLSNSKASVGLPAPKLWERLWSDDLATFAKRLSEAGFSQQSARFLLMAALDEQYRERKDALLKVGGKRLYWKSNYGKSPEAALALEKLSQEEWKTVNSLLRKEKWPKEEGVAPVNIDRYGNLPPEKKSIVANIERDYRELERGGQASPQQSLVLELEKRKDLKKALTPEELLEYDARTGIAAEMLRKQASVMNFSEAEFRALVRLQQDQIDKTLQSFAGSSAPLNREEMEKKFNDIDANAFRSVLGPERFAEYQQALDPDSKMLNRVVQKLDLPLSSAVAVTATRHEISARAEAIRFDPSLTPEQKQSQLTALTTEANNRITSALGERGAGVYRKYDGKWLDQLRTGTKK